MDSSDLQVPPEQKTGLYSRKILFLSLGGLALLAILGLIVAVYTNNNTGTVAKSAERPPNNKDFFFSDLALTLNSPQLCERIAPEAVQGFGFNPMGYKIQYAKSDCYYRIAFIHRNPDLCSKVIEKKDFGRTGRKISPEACSEDFQKDPSREDNVAHGDPDPDLLQKAMISVGYNDNKIITSSPQWADEIVMEVAESLYKKASRELNFLSKIENEPNYSEKFSETKIRPANPNEYLYQRVAIENKNPLFCNKISPNSYYVSYNYSIKPPTSLNLSIKDRCLTSIAFNTNDASLCNQVSSANSTSITSVYLNNKESCKDAIYNYYIKTPDLSWCNNKQQFPDQASAEKCRADLSHKVETSYGPTNFPSGQYFSEALKHIGQNINIKFTGLDYLNFYKFVQGSGTSEQKNELKSSLENIPDSF